MNDERKGLRPDTEYVVNDFTYIISKEIGRGGTCITYSGLRIQNDPQNINKVIIKEFFPLVSENRFSRDEHGCLVIPEDLKDDFDDRKRLFLVSQEKQNWMYSQNQDNVLPQTILVNLNETVYAVSDISAGECLSEIDFQSLTLYKIASIMESVCDCVSLLHVNEMLCIDIKPDNFYINLKPDKQDALVSMFDFGAAVSVKDVKDIRCNLYTTKGWEAPELISEGIAGKIVRSYIGYHTDIYAMGLLLFWLLTGRIANKTDLQDIANDEFRWNEKCKCLKEVDPKAIKELNNIIRPMLIQNPEKRKEAFPEYDPETKEKKEPVKKIINDQFKNLSGYITGDKERHQPIYSRIDSLEKNIMKYKNSVLITLTAVVLIIFGIMFFFPKKTEIINEINNTTNVIEMDYSKFSEQELLRMAYAAIQDENYDEAKKIYMNDKLQDNPIAMNNMGLIMLEETNDLAVRKNVVDQYLLKATSTKVGASNLLYGYVLSGEGYAVQKVMARYFCKNGNEYACAFVRQVLEDEGYEATWDNWYRLGEKTFKEWNEIGFVKYTTPPDDNEVYIYVFDSAQTYSDSETTYLYDIYKKILLANHNYMMLRQGFIKETEIENVE